jgi:hypothetical protein
MLIFSILYLLIKEGRFLPKISSVLKLPIIFDENYNNCHCVDEKRMVWPPSDFLLTREQPPPAGARPPPACVCPPPPSMAPPRAWLPPTSPSSSPTPCAAVRRVLALLRPSAPVPTVLFVRLSVAPRRSPRARATPAPDWPFPVILPVCHACDLPFCPELVAFF